MAETVIEVKGKGRYVAKVFKIESKNIRGVPDRLRMLEDEQTIQLEGDEQFMICFVPVKMLKGTI